MTNGAETKWLVEFVTRIDRPSDEKFRVLAQHVEGLAQRVSELEEQADLQAVASKAAIGTLSKALQAPTSGKGPPVHPSEFKAVMDSALGDLKRKVEAEGLSQEKHQAYIQAFTDLLE